jgi:hypothetical protein
MLNVWYINMVGELFTLNDSDTEDNYEDECEELDEPLPDF